MTDHELLRAYLERRDVESLGHFVERYQERVLRFATRLLGCQEQAQDVVQETFLQVVRHPRRLLDVDSCHNWLLRVARNIGVDRQRRAARARRHGEAIAHQSAALGAAAVERDARTLEVAEHRSRVRAEIDRLDDRAREVLLLRIEEGKSYREIAGITGLTATHVGYVLHHAMKTLAGRLQDLAPE